MVLLPITMKNPNNKIFLTTCITYKDIEKKMKKQGHLVKAKDTYCIANEDIRSRWKTKTEISIWVPELRLRLDKIHELKFKHWKQRKLYSDRARAEAISR